MCYARGFPLPWTTDVRRRRPMAGDARRRQGATNRRRRKLERKSKVKYTQTSMLQETKYVRTIATTTVSTGKRVFYCWCGDSGGSDGAITTQPVGVVCDIAKIEFVWKKFRRAHTVRGRILCWNPNLRERRRKRGILPKVHNKTVVHRPIAAGHSWLTTPWSALLLLVAICPRQYANNSSSTGRKLCCTLVRILDRKQFNQ